jgi:multidrug transporter EmrE-like cation transporter
MYLLRILPYFLVTLLFSLSGQSLLKKGLTEVLEGAHPSPFVFVTQYLGKVLWSSYFWLGTVTSGIGFFCFLYVLSRFQLGRALPILGGIAYVVMFIIGRVWFREQTTWWNFAGIVLIICGLLLVTLGGADASSLPHHR